MQIGRGKRIEVFLIAIIMTKLLGHINNKSVRNSGDAFSSKFFLRAIFFFGSLPATLAMCKSLWHMTSDRFMTYVVNYSLLVHIVKNK